MRRIRLGDRLRYRFDNLMARGPLPLLGLLILIDLLLGLGFAVVIYATGAARGEPGVEELSFGQLAYRVLLHTFEPSVLGEDRGAAGFVLAMVALTIAGIFVFGSVVGVITTGIDRQLAHLRRGRSLVLERDHTLIYGWSSQIYTIIRELVVANSEGRRHAIVVVADRDKAEMDADIHSHVRHTGRTRVITRSGDPLDHADLELGNPQHARSIIVLPPEDDGDPDMQVIKTVLALTNDSERRPEPYNIVTQLRHRSSVEVAREAGRDEAKLILDDLVITRITAQTCRQSGLSVVYTDLLDFADDEIYFHQDPGLQGQSFGEALFAYAKASVIGIRKPGEPPVLNPPSATLIAPGDSVVLIAGSAASVGPARKGAADFDALVIRPPTERVSRPERTLVLGWNRERGTLLEELDNYVAAGSEVLVVAAEAAVGPAVEARARRVHNQAVTFRQADPSERHVLESLDVPSFDHVVVLSDTEHRSPQVADARTLVTLLHLRSLEEEGGHDFQIVSEMLDLRNRRLAEVTKADDFIVSDHLVSLLTAQVAENPGLAELFDELFSSNGSEIFLRPADEYVMLGRPLRYETVVEAARRRGEVAIGYRLRGQAGDASLQYGVAVNPAKSAQLEFEPGDRVIVIGAL